MAGADHHDPTQGILFVVVTLFIAVIATVLQKRILLPFTIIMLLFGIFLGYLFQSGECKAASGDSNSTFMGCDGYSKETCAYEAACVWEGTHLKTHAGIMEATTDVWATVDPHFIMYTFLPALIYASSSSMNFHIFSKSIRQISVLAMPGVLLATSLTAFLIMTFQPEGYNWSWWSALTLGSMLSATDPVAVVALLRELNAPSNLAMVIEGESLFNDGTAFAVFLICFDAIQGATISPGGSIVYFLQLSGGGIVVGIVLGFLMVRIIEFMNDGLLEVIVTLFFAYGSFMVAEQIHVSGVLVVVLLGLVMAKFGRPLLTDEHMMHHFWELMEFIANCVIFAICGLQIAIATITNINSITSTDALFMFQIYLIISVVRIFSIAVLSPLFRSSGYGVAFSEGTVMAWAGLRGAVSLTIATMVARTHVDLLCCENTLTAGCAGYAGNFTLGCDGSNVEADRALLQDFELKILFHCAGVTFMTLIFNGTTTGKLVKFFDLGIQTTASQHAFDHACHELSKKSETKLEMLTHHEFFEHMDINQVWDMLPILNDKMLKQRLTSGKINAARYKMIDQSPFFQTLRKRYGIEKYADVTAAVKEVGEKSSDDDNDDNAPLGLKSDRFSEMQGKRKSLVSSITKQFVLDDARFPYKTWAQLEAAGGKKQQFVALHWQEIVEARRRALNVLEAIYWKNFNLGWTNDATVRVLVECGAEGMDRQRRATAIAPDEEHQAEFSINTWSLVKAAAQPSPLTNFFRRLLKLLGFKKILRHFKYYDFEHILDMAKSFSLAHTSLANRYDKLAAISWTRLDDQARKMTLLLSEIDATSLITDEVEFDGDAEIEGLSSNRFTEPEEYHSGLNPLVMDLVATEARKAANDADALINELIRGSNGKMMAASATKQAARVLLNSVRKSMEHEMHEGNLDDTEVSQMKMCLNYCEWRLQLGSIIAKPPSLESLLCKVSFLKKLKPETLKAVASTVVERHLLPGEILFQQGEGIAPVCCFFIVAGSIHLHMIEESNGPHSSDTNTTSRATNAAVEGAGMDGSPSNDYGAQDMKMATDVSSTGGCSNGTSAIISGNCTDASSVLDSTRSFTGEMLVEEIEKSIDSNNAAYDGPQQPRKPSKDMGTISSKSDGGVQFDAESNNRLNTLEYHGEIVRTARADDLLGSAAVLSGHPNFLTAVAASMSVVLYIPAAVCKALIKRCEDRKVGASAYVMSATSDGETTYRRYASAAVHPTMPAPTEKPQTKTAEVPPASSVQHARVSESKPETPSPDFGAKMSISRSSVGGLDAGKDADKPSRVVGGVVSDSESLVVRDLFTRAAALDAALSFLRPRMELVLPGETGDYCTDIRSEIESAHYVCVPANERLRFGRPSIVMSGVLASLRPKGDSDDERHTVDATLQPQFLMANIMTDCVSCSPVSVLVLGAGRQQQRERRTLEAVMRSMRRSSIAQLVKRSENGN